MQFYLATMQSSNGYPWQRSEKAFFRSLASVQVSRLNLYSQLITPRLLTTKTIFWRAPLNYGQLVKVLNLHDFLNLPDFHQMKCKKWNDLK